jgi:4-amino-4-deoxy-L-arabinose transferase-like glycosyltransferase
MRFEDTSPQAILIHLLKYPFEVLVSTLPWSPLVLGFAWGWFRRPLGKSAPFIGFLSISLAIAFASCWFVPGAKPHYLMPLYPCAALFVGQCVEALVQANPRLQARRSWSLFTLGIAVTMIAGGLAVAASTWMFGPNLLRQPYWFAALYALASAIASAILIRLHRCNRAAEVRMALFTILAWIAVSSAGVWLNVSVTTAGDPAPDVARLKAKLPAAAHLVSLGQVETLFTYLYRRPIELRRWPPSANEVGENEYFCFTWDRPRLPEFPFAWHVEATIPCDRIRHAEAVKRVIVGRRIIDSLAARWQRDVH